MIAHIGKLGGSCGGIYRYTTEVLRELAHRKVSCQTIAGTHGGLIHRYFSTRRAGASILEGNSVDLIAAHFAQDAFPLLSFVRDRAFVVHHHGPWALESKCEGDGPIRVLGKHWMERRVYSRASKIITLSEAFAELVHINYGIDRERIRVIPGGVDIERFATLIPRVEARERLGWSTNRPTLVTVRRLVKRMGLPVLINAISEVRRHHPDVVLKICGDGPVRSKLIAQVKALGLQDNVHFQGYIDEEELPLAYRAADLSVLPSIKYEGFGLAAAESLAAGTPTLASELDGLPEILRPLSSDLLVTPGSVSELADRIRLFLSGRLTLPDEAACRSHVADRYAWRLIVDRILAVYAEATQQSASRLSMLLPASRLLDVAPAR